MDDAWFSIDDRTFNRLDEDWDHNVSEVAIAIAGIAREAREFKIGIAVDPKWRWFECAGGAYSKRFTKINWSMWQTASNQRTVIAQATWKSLRLRSSRLTTDV